MIHVMALGEDGVIHGMLIVRSGGRMLWFSQVLAHLWNCYYAFLISEIESCSIYIYIISKVSFSKFNCNIFWKFNFKSGFWRIGIKPENIFKTNFVNQ